MNLSVKRRIKGLDIKRSALLLCIIKALFAVGGSSKQLVIHIPVLLTVVLQEL
jgi:hypothetical protein